jgi:hypothetical protein
VLHTGGFTQLGSAIQEIREEIQDGRMAVPDLSTANAELYVLEKAIGSYYLYWQGKGEYRELEVEKEFQVPLGDGGNIFGGKIDLITQREDGRVHLWEHKTAARTGDSYYAMLRCDPQMRGNLAGANKGLGYDITHITYDILKKPQLRQRVGETPESYAVRVAEAYLLRPEEYFERRYETISRASSDAYIEEMKQLAEMIEECLQKGYFPQQCPRVGFQCAFTPLCLEGESAEMRLYVRREKDLLHPELEMIEEDQNV